MEPSQLQHKTDLASDSDIPNKPSTSDTNIQTRSKRGKCKKDDQPGDAFQTEIREMIKSFMEDQSSRLDTLEKHIKEIKQQNDSIKTTNMDIETSLAYISDQISDLQTKIKVLEKDREHLIETCNFLRNKIEIYERNSVKFLTEVRCVPKRKKETKQDLFSLIQKLYNHLKVNINAYDIRDVQRIPCRRDQQNSTLIIEYSNTLVKAEFLNAIKIIRRISLVPL